MIWIHGSRENHNPRIHRQNRLYFTFSFVLLKESLLRRSAVVESPNQNGFIHYAVIISYSAVLVDWQVLTALTLNMFFVEERSIFAATNGNRKPNRFKSPCLLKVLVYGISGYDGYVFCLQAILAILNMCSILGYGQKISDMGQ